MASNDWPVLIFALILLGVALACLVGVIVLNWRRPTEPRGFEVEPPRGSSSLHH